MTPRTNDKVLERRRITAGPAVAYLIELGTTKRFWLNLQDAYDVSKVMAERGDQPKLTQPLTTP
jgi:plasmid maintenance system antidote protein VapI